MKLLVLLLLVGLAASAPRSSNDGTTYITEDFFSEEFKKYTSKHDIVNIFVPLNALNAQDDSDSTKNDVTNGVIFFVEGDNKEDGTIDNKGLFVFKVKTKEATKLLDNGVDFTAVTDDTKNVYFATTDGIYVYNAVKNKAEKYGSVTDNIINIAKSKSGDIIYALTANKVLYKVTENGEKQVKIDDVQNAHKIVLDDKDNLYFYDDAKHIYVVTKEGSRKIEGLPGNPNEIVLLRPAFIFHSESIPAVIDGKVYLVHADGTAELKSFELKVHPTAYALDATLVQYYAYKKSIYEFKVLEMLTNSKFEKFKKHLNKMIINVQKALKEETQ